MTAGTLFDRRRTPLTVWFEACWLFASGKDGMSALSLQRSLEIGFYATAWAMLHRLRSVLVRPGRDRLTGTVEVDETYVGGEEPGLRGGRAKGKKVLVGVAIEVIEPRGFGRCRMQVLTDASAATLHAFITANVEPGARVIPTAGRATKASNGSATPTSRAANAPPVPAARTPASCCPVSTGSRRWPSAGCWAPTRPRSRSPICRATYKFVFRFNRRRSRARGMPSTASSNSPSPTRRGATASWWQTRSPSLSRPSRREEVATHRAWTGPARTAHGAGRPAHWSGQLNSPNPNNAPLLAGHADTLGYTTGERVDHNPCRTGTSAARTDVTSV